MVSLIYQIKWLYNFIYLLKHLFSWVICSEYSRLRSGFTKSINFFTRLV